MLLLVGARHDGGVVPNSYTLQPAQHAGGWDVDVVDLRTRQPLVIDPNPFSYGSYGMVHKAKDEKGEESVVKRVFDRPRFSDTRAHERVVSLGPEHLPNDVVAVQRMAECSEDLHAVHSVNVKRALLRTVAGTTVVLDERYDASRYRWELPQHVHIQWEDIDFVEYFQVMEACVGDFDRSYSVYRDNTSPEDRARHIEQLAATLQALAACGGMILTDAKRANLLVGTDENDAYVPLLGDLGSFFPVDSDGAITTFRLPDVQERENISVAKHAARFAVMVTFVLADAIEFRVELVNRVVLPRDLSQAERAELHIGSVRKSLMADVELWALYTQAEAVDMLQPSVQTAASRYSDFVGRARALLVDRLHPGTSPGTPPQATAGLRYWYYT